LGAPTCRPTEEKHDESEAIGNSGEKGGKKKAEGSDGSPEIKWAYERKENKLKQTREKEETKSRRNGRKQIAKWIQRSERMALEETPETHRRRSHR